MLFQNREDEDAAEESPKEDIADTNLLPQNENLLTTVLPCQTLSNATNLGKRGEISADLITGEFKDTVSTTTKEQFKIWCAARSSKMANQTRTTQVPSFVATNSLFADPVDAITKFAFTPIIPYPATEYDTIFTCMRNFQDVLLQRKQEYGPLWCDEGVYRIAKEFSTTAKP